MAETRIPGELVNRALALIQNGREAEGCEALASFLSQHIEGNWGPATVARFLWQNGFPNEAHAMFRHAGEVDADDEQALHDLVIGLFDAQQWNEVIPHAEKLSKIRPEDSVLYQIMAWSYYGAGAYDGCRGAIRRGIEKGRYGINFQPGSPTLLDEGHQERIAAARDAQADERLAAARGLYDGPGAVTWAADEIGPDRARLGGATVGAEGNARFEVTPVDEPKAKPRLVDAEADGGDGTATIWRATVDGLAPGTAYRARLVAAGASGDAVAFTTGIDAAAELGGLDAVWSGNTGAVLAGTVGGTTLPTRYRFAYGDAPDRLEHETPEKWVPPGRTLRAWQEAVDAIIEWKVCTVERDVIGDDPEPDSPDAFALRLIGPFCKDRNHTTGIGVGDLFLGWFARWFTDSESDETGRAHCTDLRDAEAEFVMRPKGLDARDFVLAGVVQSSTGEQSTSAMKDTATWCLTGQTVVTDTLDEKGWNRLRFTYPSAPRAWTFCGNNPVEQSEAARYAYMPIDDVLANHKGNIVFWFALGDWRDPPLGSLDLRAMGLRWRGWSVLSPAMGARLTEFPADSLSDPLSLTGGWFDNPDAMWFSAPDPKGPQAFTWSFEQDVPLTAVKLHQNPLRPTRTIRIQTLTDDEAVETDGAGELPAVKSLVERPKPVVVALSGRPVRHLRLVVESGYQDDFWGLDAIEAFYDDAVPVPEAEPASVCDEITGLTPGRTLYYKLVAENDAGTSESPVQEIAIPETRAPAIMNGRCMAQTETRVRLFLEVRPGGLETTITGTITDPVGETWPGREQTVGENAAVRHAVFALDCPRKSGTYRAEITAANKAGESPPFRLEWEG